jgi:hypothetical protein
MAYEISIIGGHREAGGRAFASRAFAQMSIAEGEVEELQPLADSRRLTLEADFEVFEADLGIRLPLHPDTISLLGGVLVIEHVDRRPGSLLVQGTFRQAVPAPSGSAVVLPALLQAGAVLVNPDRNEYLKQYSNSRHELEHRAPAQYLVPGSLLLEESISWLFDEAAARRRDDPPLPDEWFDGVELRLVELRYAGSFTKAFDVELDAWPDWNARGVKVGADPR